MEPSTSSRRGMEAWSTDAWRAEALAWADRGLAVAGWRRSGPIAEQRIRPWGTVLALPTDHGRVWLKAAAPATAFEAALYPILQRGDPALTLTPLAVDTARGWLLLPDGGRALSEVVTGDALVDALAATMARYGKLQRAVAGDVGAMLAAGVPDMRPAALPARFEEALADAERYVAEHGTAEDRATLSAIAGMRDRVAGWAAALAAGPVPASIDHSDLHPRNILVPEGDVGRARVYDWGDAGIAHPFTTLLVTSRALAAELGVPPEDAAVARVRDAYMEVFDDVAPRQELLELAGVACHLGKIVRSRSWSRAVATMPPEEAGGDAAAPFGWLATLLDPSPLG